MDKVVDYIGGLLNLKCTEDGLLQDPEQQSYFIYPSQFMTQLLNKGDKFRDGKYTYENVERYTKTKTKTIDIFAYDKVFVPTNFSNMHWYFAMINMTEKTIQIYNSSEDGEFQANQDLRHLLHYLQDEHNQRKDGIAPPFLNQWQLINNQRSIPPSQTNCMFYVLFLLDQIASLL